MKTLNSMWIVTLDIECSHCHDYLIGEGWTESTTLFAAETLFEATRFITMTAEERGWDLDIIEDIPTRLSEGDTVFYWEKPEEALDKDSYEDYHYEWLSLARIPFGLPQE